MTTGTRVPLAIALALAAVLAWGAWQRLRPIAGGEALQILTDGAPDRALRLRCLAILRDGPATDAPALARAAGAALVLEDRSAFERIKNVAKGSSPFVPDGRGSFTEADLDAVSLDEPSLKELQRGWAERNAGRLDAARAAFARAASSARLFGLAQIERLATEALR